MAMAGDPCGPMTGGRKRTRRAGGRTAGGRCEITVSLPPKQQRVLDRIESILRDSDPRLMAMFVIFTRLTRDEEMPRLEELRARLGRLRTWISWRTAPVRRRAGQPSQRLRAILFFPAALVAMLCALLIG